MPGQGSSGQPSRDHAAAGRPYAHRSASQARSIPAGALELDRLAAAAAVL